MFTAHDGRHPPLSWAQWELAVCSAAPSSHARARDADETCLPAQRITCRLNQHHRKPMAGNLYAVRSIPRRARQMWRVRYVIRLSAEPVGWLICLHNRVAGKTWWPPFTARGVPRDHLRCTAVQYSIIRPSTPSRHRVFAMPRNNSVSTVRQERVVSDPAAATESCSTAIQPNHSPMQ